MPEIDNTRSSLNLKSRKTKKDQFLLGIASLIIIIIIGVLLSTISHELSFFWITGICFGFILQKSRFCFTASLRDPYLTGMTSLTKAVLIALAITTIGFTSIKYGAYSNGLPIPGQSYVDPISLATVIGAFMFGIGMVIAGGCASGTFMRIGDGFLLQIISLFFFIIGSLWAAHDFGWWKLNFILKGKKVFLPNVLGWFGAVVVQLSIIAILYILADKWQRKKVEFKEQAEVNLLSSARNGGVTKISQNKYYKIWVKNSWPYVVGAVLLSVLQIVTLAVTSNPWGVSGTIAYWGAWLYQGIGGNVAKWNYFCGRDAQAIINSGFLNDPGTMRNLGIIFGSLLAALLASQFRIKKIKSIKQVIAAVAGGLLMGYGSVIALGCNIGSFYSGIASLSLSGWVFALFLFLGAIVGSKILVKFFM